MVKREYIEELQKVGLKSIDGKEKFDDLMKIKRDDVEAIYEFVVNSKGEAPDHKLEFVAVGEEEEGESGNPHPPKPGGESLSDDSDGDSDDSDDSDGDSDDSDGDSDGDSDDSDGDSDDSDKNWKNISRSGSYLDSFFWEIDGAMFTNLENDGDIEDIKEYSYDLYKTFTQYQKCVRVRCQSTGVFKRLFIK